MAWCMLALSFCLLVSPMHLPGDYRESKYQAIKMSRDKIQVTNTTVRCFVNAGLIITFPSNFSDQLRQDVLYSFLFAQLGANYNASKDTQLEKWENFFTNVLIDLLWMPQKTVSGDLSVKHSKFNLSNLALDIMSWNSMAGDVNTFKKVFSTFNALPSNDSAVETFTKSAYGNTTHDVTIMVASVYENGIVNLLLVSLQGVKDSTSRPLSHTYTTKKIKTKKMMYYQLFFNEELYAHERQTIADRLKPFIKDNIKEVKLKE